MFLMFVQFSLCQATFIILLTASILVTAKQYMGGLHIHQFTKRQRGRQRKRQIQAICWWVRPKYTKREVIWAMPERKHFVSGSGPLEVNTKITLKVPNVQKNIHFCHQFFSRRPNWLHCWRRCALRRDGHLLLDPLDLHVGSHSSQFREWKNFLWKLACCFDDTVVKSENETDFYKRVAFNTLMTQGEKQSCGWGWQRSRSPRSCSSGRRSGEYQVVFLVSLFSVFVLFELFLFSLSGTTNITSGFASHSTFKQSSSTYPGFKWSDWR